jgi:hypothetical protein
MIASLMIQDWSTPGFIDVRGGLNDSWMLIARQIEERQGCAAKFLGPVL